MKIINNIAVFDNDECFLSMLKGYCYANNIDMTKVEFSVSDINRVESLNSDLMFIPVSLLDMRNAALEKMLLMLAAGNQVKICGLNRSSFDVLIRLPEWMDMVINDPSDIREIDEYVKKNFIIKSSSFAERRQKERRSFSERRKIEFFGNNASIDNYAYKESEKPCFSFAQTCENHDLRNFQIDRRNRCVFIHGQKIDLTRKEYELFELLSTDIDRVFLTEEIIEHLWPENSRATKSDLYQYMHLLRKKIEKDPNNPKWILTIKGFGYRLNIDGHEETIGNSFFL